MQLEIPALESQGEIMSVEPLLEGRRRILSYEKREAISFLGKQR